MCNLSKIQVLELKCNPELAAVKNLYFARKILALSGFEI